MPKKADTDDTDTTEADDTRPWRERYPAEADHEEPPDTAAGPAAGGGRTRATTDDT